MTDLSKKDIQRLIEVQVEKTIIEEGLTDWLKKGVQAASGAWEGLKDKLSSAASGLKNALQQKLAQAKQAYPQAVQQYKELKAIEAEAGQKMPVDNVIQLAQSLPAEGKAAIAEVQGEQKAVQQAANQAQKKQPNQQQTPQAQQAQEAYTLFAATLMFETTVRHEKENDFFLRENKMLQEVDPFGAIGLGLGVIGGVPLLLKGLYKFASFLKMQKTAEFFKKAYTVAHHIEEKAIDVIVPDKLSYLYYTKKYNMVRAKSQPPALPFEQYRQSNVRKKVEKQMYLIMLVPFFLHGLTAVAHAGISLIGAAEGAATTVKAVELGQGLVQLAGQASSA